ncbi:hypothetical protein HGI30_16625 [Paenibacillus albicereus]|uniref:Preprotein translocase subunit SecB n=1 Tax=Paenibacillus albicereus TaxID=2726185 RepID=A0A6H2H109_9BACL|nr:protein-export chaperone SecB [Paenibacillus albicereus]QJC53038.1 hypothetical protein HGI30_16625 [Paenibacillus albicereus]
MLAQIQLTNYYISRINFKYTPESVEVDEKSLKIAHDIEFLENNLVKVIVKCSVGDETGLLLNVILVGEFKITRGNDADEEEIQELCENNTLAILFPYLRSAISDISLKANTQPIILPTINIYALIEDQKKAKKLEEELKQ